jgi:hypothetical protein
MLFKASITDRVLESEDALVEQLYIFLKEYVRSRLIYESEDEKEDCVQETIMYMLKRYRQLSKKELKDINMEKFFYNRAHSYISLYLTKLKTERNARKKYLSKAIYAKSFELDGKLEMVNLPVLKSIISGYNLNKRKAEALLKISENKLNMLGYSIPSNNITGINEEEYNVLDTLGSCVVDEYMIKSIEDD